MFKPFDIFMKKHKSFSRKKNSKLILQVHDNLHIEICCCSREAVKKWMVELVIEVVKTKWRKDLQKPALDQV